MGRVLLLRAQQGNWAGVWGRGAMEACQMRMMCTTCCRVTSAAEGRDGVANVRESLQGGGLPRGGLAPYQHFHLAHPCAAMHAN